MNIVLHPNEEMYWNQRWLRKIKHSPMWICMKVSVTNILLRWQERLECHELSLGESGWHRLRKRLVTLFNLNWLVLFDGRWLDDGLLAQTNHLQALLGSLALVHLRLIHSRLGLRLCLALLILPPLPGSSCRAQLDVERLCNARYSLSVAQPSRA